MTNIFQQPTSVSILSRSLPPPSSYGGPPTPPTSATTTTTTSSKNMFFTGYNETAPQPTLSSNSSPLKPGDNSHHYMYVKKEDHEIDELTTDKMDQLIERKRKRRESHNVVERKRRDNINTRIDELGTLLPPQKQTLKLNRGIILQNSVDHIRMLQQLVLEQEQRIHELEGLLGRNTLNGNHRRSDVSHHHHHHQPDQQQQQQQQQYEKHQQRSYYQQNPQAATGSLPDTTTPPYAVILKQESRSP